jgi:hypothetical protein
MHRAIDEVLPTLRSLVGELRSDDQTIRAVALEKVASRLANSRSYVAPPTAEQFEELKDALPKPRADLPD